MKKRNITIAVFVLLLSLGVGVYFLWGDDSKVDDLLRKHDEMFAAGKPPSREQFEKLRGDMENLTPDQRRKFHDGMRKRMERHMGKEWDDFLATPKEERNDLLDKRIDREETRRKEMERRRQSGEAGPPGGPPMGRGGAGGAGAGNGPRGGRGGFGASPEERAKHHSRRLNRSSPMHRAKRSAMREAMQKRRVERGLPAHPPHPSRRPGHQISSSGRNVEPIAPRRLFGIV